MKTKNKHICVIDHGDNIYVAKMLTKFYDKVSYCYTDWGCGFSELAAKYVGYGIEGVEHILDLNDHEDDVDTFFFCDVEYGGLSNRLRRDGRNVWGGGDAELLELDRGLFLKTLRQSGLPVPKTEEIKGFDKLEKRLKGEEDVYVKLSFTRGLSETFHYVNDVISESDLTMMKLKAGALRNEVMFYIQQPIDTILEWGYDTHIVEGKSAKRMNFGFEKKSSFWFGRQIDELPDDMKEVNKKYESILNKYEYTGSFSGEVRIAKDKTQYFIDPTPRQAFPSGASYMQRGTNWGDVIEGAMKGEIVELDMERKYGVETVVSTSCMDRFNPILFDEKYEDNVFPCYYCVIDGVTYRLPNNQLYNATNKLCTVVTQSDTLNEAIEKNMEICNSIKAKGIQYETDVKEFADQCIKELKDTTGIQI